MQREVTASIKTELFSKSDQTVLNSKSECKNMPLEVTSSLKSDQGVLFSKSESKNKQPEVTSSLKSDQTVLKIRMQKHATKIYFIN